MEEGPASEEAAAALFLNMTPSELTRTRMPLLGDGSVEAEVMAGEGEGAEVEGESGIGIVRTGRPKLGPPPAALRLEVSVMLCRSLQV